MTFQSTGYITDVPYAWPFAKELAPAWLDLVALLSGFEPRSRAGGFSWCDLGCGHGLTASILAATHPTGRFCGIDFNASHIDGAKHFADECEIDNVDFHHADFSTAIESVAGGFDYIVCHGVYSWVDKESQNALLQFVDRHLNPGGFFYVSYRCLVAPPICRSNGSCARSGLLSLATAQQDAPARSKSCTHLPN